MGGGAGGEGQETKTISPVEGFHIYDLSVLVKMHTAGRINRKILFFDFNDQFYVMIGGAKNFMGRK